MTDSSDPRKVTARDGGGRADLPRRVLDNLLEGCQVISRDFRYLYVNDAAVEHGRTSREQLLGRTMMEANPGIEDTKMFSVLRRCMEDRSPRRMENELTFPDGTTGWFELLIEPMPDGATILSMDITCRKQDEEALRNSEVRYRLFRELVDQSGDAVEVLDPDSGRFLEVNETGCRDLGYSLEELRALTVFDINPEVDPKAFGEVVQHIREEGQMLWEGVHRRKDGSEFPVEVSIKRVQLDREYLVSVVRDITQRREADLALRRSRDTQETVASILRLSLEDAPLDKILLEVLRMVLSISWLSVENKGAILLVEDDPEILVMKAQEGLPEVLIERCAHVPFGRCLCGRAAATDEVAHAAGLDARHHTKYDGMTQHGHYCVPISHAGKVLGVLNAYTAAGHAHSQQEVDFLTTVANTLAGVILRERAVEERHKLEQQVNLSQRLEAIGRLAGGVAHDFNNLLTVINNFAIFAIEALHASDPVQTDIIEIKNAGQRAAALTRQLLAFSRKQILEPQLLNLNQVVGEIENMLRRLIGEDIDIVVRKAEDLGSVEADPGQLEQVIMNLAVNARDAMPHGGKLTIETSNVELNEEYVSQHGGVEAGRFVQLTVTDSGGGMDAETRERVFEPFFTTKEKGKGTGLGLSTVYGIVKQSGGNILVSSELERGTMFSVHLPRKETSATEIKRKPVTVVLRGIETVLVVEDEDVVRRLVERILRSAGYRVLVAADGDDALALVERHQGKVDLLLTDVVMPGMSGRELAEQLATRHQKLKRLYMSGYTDNAIVHHGVLDAATHFIGKPFSSAELTRKVREVLDKD